jgi:hypothetical protein
MRMPNGVPWLIFLVGALGAGTGCGNDVAHDDDFLDCAADKCDSVGPLTVSRRWIPEGGFIRVTLAAGHTLSVEPSGNMTSPPALPAAVASACKATSPAVGRAGAPPGASPISARTSSTVRTRSASRSRP